MPADSQTPVRSTLPVELVMDSVSITSEGGEQLQAELSAALDRTCPSAARATILRRPDQHRIGHFRRIADEVVEMPVMTMRQRWTWLREGLPQWVCRLGATAVFVANGLFSSRIRRQCGVIATTNQMLPFSSDQLSDYPLSARAKFLLLRSMTVRGLRMADAVVLHSQHALDSVTPFVGDMAAKSAVVLTGVPGDALLSDGAVPPEHPYGGRPYLLYLSPIYRYKNHLRLIEAYRGIAERVVEFPDLVVAGPCKDAAYLSRIERAIAGAALGSRIRYLGSLPRSAVAGWLHHATVNVFPSLCETNSVIQAEILGARGVMATSADPPMSEVAGGAAELFDPNDTEDIAAVLERLWRSPRRRDELRRLAAKRARSLSWDSCGEVIWRAAKAAGDCYRRRVA